MTTITLRGGLTAHIDDADLPLLRGMSLFVWARVTPSGRVYRYLAYKRGAERGLVHRVLTGAGPGLKVDHRDGDGLNNVRSNLRTCTHAENMRNRRPTRGKALPKGVGKGGRTTFYAQIRAGKVRLFKGGFATAEAAADHYLGWARELHGAFAFAPPVPEATEKRAA